MKQIATRHKPHFIGISEVNLSRNELVPDDNENNNELSTEQAHEKLKIEGYRLFLPTSWTEHNKARLIVYVDENISVKFQDNPSHSSHIQNILLEVGFGQAKKHFVSFYYREWKSCVNGLNSKEAQIEYFNSLINTWKDCTSADEKDFIALGDTNICASKMDDPHYVHKDLANIYKDFLAEETCHQIVNGVTRIRSVGGEIQRSCLDHITVNCVNKMSVAEIIGVGESDHLGVLVSKKTRDLRSSPKTIKKRIYKKFDRNNFIQDIIDAKESGQFAQIHNADDIDEATEAFTKVRRSNWQSKLGARFEARSPGTAKRPPSTKVASKLTTHSS